MKRKFEHVSSDDSNYEGGDDSSSNSDCNSGSDTDSDCGYHSDSEVDYGPQREFIVIVNNATTENYNEALQMSRQGTINHLPKKKTKLDKKRDAILKKIEDLKNNKDMSLTDRVIFSKFPLSQKANLLQELVEKSMGSDKTKYTNYVERVLKIPVQEFKGLNIDSTNEKFLLDLRNNLDKSIYGHRETKEEIIDYMAGRLTNPDYTSNILALQSEPGFGKCLGKDTPVLMYDGSIKKVQDVVKGDRLMGDDSTPRRVLTLGGGSDEMYKITHNISKRSYITNSEHILTLVDQDDNILEIEVKDFYKFPDHVKFNYRGYSNSIEFQNPLIATNGFLDGKEINLKYNKIPDFQKLASASYRIKFLSGLVEQMGVYNTKCIQLFPNNDRIIDDIMFIINSLGFTASIDVVNNVKIITIKDNIALIKFPELYRSLQSKENISITPLPRDNYYGFTIDGNHRFVLGNMIVTHNTRFIRALGRTLDTPFKQISFGGMSDNSILLGHDYTYIGSKPGKIYDVLVKSKCMNPIVYLDEIDKIGELGSQKTTEINGILTHLLDKEQNSEFYDHYIGDIPLDLSKVLFIVSFNNIHNVDPVVLNRLKVIKIKESTEKEKIEIVKQFTIPEICKNLKIEDISIDESIIKYIIRNKAPRDKGMRSINNTFATLYGKMNTLVNLENIEKDTRIKIVSGFSYEKVCLTREDGKYKMTVDLVDKLLHREIPDVSHLSMYN